ncbi:translocation protein [Microstroma glucosiphilum]|uniref:Translocation protein SEC62 n=1 Tax=Pseudomicrostroma glucosiphilum TaxID=1684307 RepID=A0A316UA53_9BASI|nr:translocation protein [Pseudomicrostroma glucosiphilum]PWN22039.1 translocation protein [Pseudomicrostroma glucosiphilum]
MEQQTNAPPEARAIAVFLRNSSLVPVRNGILGGTRYPYFHGTRAVAALLSPSYAKLASKAKLPLPVPQDEEDAERILHGILPFAFFLRVERGEQVGQQKKKEGGMTERLRELKVVQQQMFKKEMHYAFFFEGSQLRVQLMGLGMVVILLAAVMFPLWPPIMRLGVWYLSIGALGIIALFFAVAIIRLILWGATAVFGRGWWLFPNLFADVGFVDSFIPVWDWDVPAPPKKVKKAKSRPQIEGGEGSSKAPAALKAAAGKGELGVSSKAGSGTSTPAKGNGTVSEVAAAPAAKVKRESDRLGDLD